MSSRFPSGGSGAPLDATYATLSANATLTNERVLTAGSNITLTDGGAGSTLTIASSGGSGISFADLASPPGGSALGSEALPFLTTNVETAPGTLPALVDYGNEYGAITGIADDPSTERTTGVVGIGITNTGSPDYARGLYGIASTVGGKLVNLELDSYLAGTSVAVDAPRGIYSYVELAAGTHYPQFIHLAIDTPALGVGALLDDNIGLNINDQIVSGIAQSYAIRTLGLAPSLFGGTVTATDHIWTGTKTANFVLAGPTTGSAAAPAFRALVAADMPAVGLTTTITTESLAGKTITITNGLMTGFA